MKLIIYNFIKEQASIIYNLMNKSGIEIVEWFSYPPHGTTNISDFADVKFYTENAHGLGEGIYDEVFSDYYLFLDMHQRRYRYFQNNIYDIQRDFNNQFSAIVKFLQDKKPDLILFGNIPHGGHDFLLYRIARLMNIKTLILFQIPVCPRFMLMESFENLGDTTYLKENKIETVCEELPEIKTPVYMHKKNKNFSIAKKIIKTFIIDPFRKSNTFENILYRVLMSKSEIQFRKELKNHLTYIPKEKPYIYFPLHLQPEMATASLSGKYVDQVLAIERLSKKVGDRANIIVKENPKQTSYQRPKNFYQRLKSLSNIKIVSTKINTFELISNSIAVATITGTVGWEGINLNKPAIIFGNTWYQSLPGVVKYNSQLELEDIKNFNIDKRKIKIKYDELMKHSFSGIVQSAYFPLIPSIDIEENNEHIAECIYKVILE